MAELITFERLFCLACDMFTWHIFAKDGSWECLQCRSQVLEDALAESFIILAQ